jgi:hypothetical protein
VPGVAHEAAAMVSTVIGGVGAGLTEVGVVSPCSPRQPTAIAMSNTTRPVRAARTGIDTSSLSALPPISPTPRTTIPFPLAARTAKGQELLHGSWRSPVVARWWQIDAVDRVAVLRVTDQRAGRTPRRCVKTGERTDGAVRVRAVALRRAHVAQLVAGFALTRVAAWLLRRPSFPTVVAVSPLAWQRWQRSLLFPAVIGPAGAALVVFGVIAGAAPAVVFGTLFLVAAALLRWRATKRWWIGVRFRPERDEIVVARVSTGFDEDARRLYVRSVTPR